VITIVVDTGGARARPRALGAKRTSARPATQFAITRGIAAPDPIDAPPLASATIRRPDRLLRTIMNC